MKKIILCIMMLPYFLKAEIEMPKEIFNKIVADAERRYPTDYSMINCVVENQIEEYKKYMKLKEKQEKLNEKKI